MWLYSVAGGGGVQLVKKPDEVFQKELGEPMYQMDISLIQDGNSTLEHNLPVEHFYDDVVSLRAQTKTNYTPTWW